MTSKPGVSFSQCNLKRQHHYYYKHWSHVPKCGLNTQLSQLQFPVVFSLPRGFSCTLIQVIRKNEEKLKETYVCYESVIHVSYSLATLVVKLLLLAVSVYPLPIPKMENRLLTCKVQTHTPSSV